MDINVPILGESITEATVTKWLKSIGDTVIADEALVELETDKVSIEVNAPAAGVVIEILAGEGSDVAIGALLCRVGEVGEDATALSEPATKIETKMVPAPKIATEKADINPPAQKTPSEAQRSGKTPVTAQSPAVRRLIAEHGLDPATITASRKDGRLTKGDILANLTKTQSAPPKAADEPEPPHAAEQMPAVQGSNCSQYPPRQQGPREERIRMSRLRRMVASRLKEAQNTAVILTTFNEIDMTEVIAARARYRESFKEKNGVRLGFMSFFVKASILALGELPAINAEIDGDEIIYKNYYDIGVAVGSEHGLVVPVLRGADSMSFADIEKNIGTFGHRAREGKLTINELQGGTFTITNGGIFGSMMSTPILNTPQSGILGMHNIIQRPKVMPDGSITARAMMYVALSYDHRIVDGREAVMFLVRVKECIENPERIMLGA